jgi:flagellar protein FliO/FliZ
VSFDIYWRFILALAFVVLLIGGCAWLARRFGLAGRFVVTGAKRRLAVIEVLPLDGKHRLVLLRRDEAEHLVLLGQHTDLVIERGGGNGFSTMVDGGTS